MRSTEELVNALRSAPSQWTDAAIVVAFDNRFEFVKEDTPDATGRLKLLEERGGLAIGLAGVENANAGRVFMAKVFPEYEGQGWAHRSIDRLRKMVHRQSHKNSERLPIHLMGPEEF